MAKAGCGLENAEIKWGTSWLRARKCRGQMEQQQETLTPF